MKKLTNRMIALSLAVTLSMPYAVFAGQTDKLLEATILKAKKLIEVPSELTEFEYSIDNQMESEEEVIFRMEWHDKEYEKGIVSVTLDSKGNIIYFNQDNFQNKASKQLNISYQEGLKIAQNFLKDKISTKGEFKQEGYIQPNTGASYTYTFYEYINGIKVLDAGVVIEVNKSTGKIVSYQGFNPFEGEYASNQGAIALDRAQTLYLEKIDLPLIYQLNRDYNTKTVTSIPIYRLANFENKAIDALTGEVIIPFEENKFYPMEGSGKEVMMGEIADRGEADLSVEEQKEVTQASKLLSGKEIVQKNSIYFPRLKDAVIGSMNLYKDHFEDGKYIWNIVLREPNKTDDEAATMYLTADAKTGEVLNYNLFTPQETEQASIGYKMSKNKVEGFLKQIAGDKYKETKLIQNEMEQEKEVAENYSFFYGRFKNGAQVETNELTVNYNAKTQEVNYYSVMWDKVEFKDIKNAVSKKILLNQLNLQLMYVNKDKNTKVLAYVAPENYMAFDALTGKRVRPYDGKPYQEEVQEIEYTDIAGHPSEAIIKKLIDCGVRVEGRQFKPNAKIIQEDFIRMLLKATSKETDSEELYQRAISAGILTQEEVSKEKNISYNEASRYIIKGLGYDKVAKLKGIYSIDNPKLKNIEENNLGYIALTYGLGILSLKAEQEIDLSQSITRAQAAEMIYQMILCED